METGNASISEERPLECAEHQSCVLSPEVPSSPKAKSKYMYSGNTKAVLNFSSILTFIQTYLISITFLIVFPLCIYDESPILTAYTVIYVTQKSKELYF